MQEIIKASIRTIPDYPKAGIQFRDITTLLADPTALRMTIDSFVHRYIRTSKINAIAGIEARGFIFGAALAYELGIKFIPIRKSGKLPGKTISQSYQLEYGEDQLEIDVDSISVDDQIILVDDLIATGGTAEAAIKLIRQLNGHVVEAAFVVDLPDLGGTQRLQETMDCPCFSICDFDDE
ncbi:MAG TPA: adenine phosphoribosyltransferase [Thiotrichaceae bacterium]|nr:adenine phosphoribosyltransferase [Thiotrichaceae bacterium]